MQGGGDEYVCTTLAPVPNCNPDDTLLSLPQIRCYIMPGVNGSTSWVMVSEFSVEGVLGSLPVSTPGNVIHPTDARETAATARQPASTQLPPPADLRCARLTPAAGVPSFTG